MKRYQVSIPVTGRVVLDVQAENEAQAESLALDMFEDGRGTSTVFYNEARDIETEETS